MKTIEGVRQNGYAKNAKKKVRRVGYYNGSFARASASQGFFGRPIQSAMQVSAGGPPGTAPQ